MRLFIFMLISSCTISTTTLMPVTKASHSPIDTTDSVALQRYNDSLLSDGEYREPKLYIIDIRSSNETKYVCYNIINEGTIPLFIEPPLYSLEADHIPETPLPYYFFRIDRSNTEIIRPGETYRGVLEIPNWEVMISQSPLSIEPIIKYLYLITPYCWVSGGSFPYLEIRPNHTDFKFGFFNENQLDREKVYYRHNRSYVSTFFIKSPLVQNR